MSVDWTNTAKRAAVVGALAGAATQLYYGDAGSVYLLGSAVPASVGVGLSAAAGSVAADVLNVYAPQTSIPDLGATPIELAGAALVTTGTLDWMGINNGYTIEGAALGAAALVGGRYVNNMYLMM